ncbi:MAG: glutamine synthetase III [Bacilli bacterium]|nr:glutamine synthetase III [Bacilli bacterium]
MEKNNIIENYGCYIFNDEVMKERLPKNIYEEFHKSLNNNEPLSKKCSDIIADAMKNWAIEKGATHFTHWFAPLTGLTAEKHDSFLELVEDKPILDFNGKLLRKGETDASSFPSGGLRATFEARGYTAWDCTSHAFVKDGSLYIPTLFYSYTGESLDNKTPLLKSCDALNKAAIRLLNLLGFQDVTSVTSFVGSEQEYFLVPEEFFEKRLDLKLTGRTLFGAHPSKGQDFEGHYYGYLNSKVANFMKELDSELWKYGIPAKTKHNEAAPAQHELACIYRKVNTTTDNNHLLMQLMQDIAKKHGLRCLLHEKPFDGVNGSGKHNNWSVVTNTKINLFNPGIDPINNLAFIATLACLVKGVDEYADLLRLSIATAGNDHRLGGNEAPPATISMFLGEPINNLIDAYINDLPIVENKNTRFQTGVLVIPDFKKDSTDRNRTSPFAFTGNKFEFRGVGSSQSIAIANTMLNSILAYTMEEMANEIESGKTINAIIKDYFNNHRRVIFEGDGYSNVWEKEVKERNLSNKKNTVDAIQVLKDDKITKPLTSLGVLSEAELLSRYEIMLDNYSKTIQVEAATALKIAKNQIFPACLEYLNKLSIVSLNVEGNKLDNSYLKEELNEINDLIKNMKKAIKLLEDSLHKVLLIKGNDYNKAIIYKDEVLASMSNLRKIVDTLENKVDSKCWPVPTYTDILFGVN